MMRITWITAVTMIVLLAATFLCPATAVGNPQDAQQQKILDLEKKLAAVIEELQALKSKQDAQADLEKQLAEIAAQLQAMKSKQDAQSGQKIAELNERVDAIEQLGLMDEMQSQLKSFTFGGYGEMHANFSEGSAGDQFDLHRLVLYLGYDFNDWIKFHSETEIEHAYVTSGSGGELSMEQAHVDFLLSDLLNVRVGRFLTPLGIINQKHEPPTFNGVERPSFSKYVIPSTWSTDGVGLFGNLSSALKYQIYGGGGLDGSMFTAKDGIRKGRIKERPSLHDPAVMGRLDFFPLAKSETTHGQTLRFGMSGYYGGLDNANKGKNPGTKGNITIASGDFEYTISKFDFRGAVAHESIDDADKIPGVAEEIFGWYLEGACHVMPDSWKKGKLEKADAVVFARYDDYNTQYKMPSGVGRNRAADRDEWTFGVSFFPTPSFVIKADYQLRNNGTSTDLDDQFNLGVGWWF